MEGVVKTTTTKDWLVVYTKSRYEKKVAEQLTEMGIEAYCPLIKRKKQWSDRVKLIEEPILKSYCLLRVSKEQYKQALEIHGVVRYVYYLGKPAIVSAADVKRMKKWLQDIGPAKVTVVDFKPGDELIIKSGPFMNERASLVERKGKVLRLTLIQLGVMITLDARKNIVEKDLVKC